MFLENKYLKFNGLNLSIETIESKLSKQTDIQQSLEKLRDFYSNRGINLICI